MMQDKNFDNSPTETGEEFAAVEESVPILQAYYYADSAKEELESKYMKRIETARENYEWDEDSENNSLHHYFESLHQHFDTMSDPEETLTFVRNIICVFSVVRIAV